MAILAKDLRDAVLQAAIQGKLTEQLDSDSSVDEFINNSNEQKKILIKSKKIKNVVVKDVTEDDELFELPPNWRWIRFGSIANLRMGKTPPRSESKYWGSDYKWVSIADMIDSGYISNTKEGISEYGFKNKFNNEISPSGTLIMSFKLTIGRVSILDVPALHNEAIISIFPYNDTDNILRNYLFKTLTFLSKYGDSKSAIKGSTLNSKSLNNLLIPLPPIEEQQRIVNKIEELMKKIDEYEKIENQLEELKKQFPIDMKDAILQAAMQGKLTKQLDSDTNINILYQKIKDNERDLINKKFIKRTVIEEISDNEISFDIPKTWKFVRLNEIGQIVGGGTPKTTNKNYWKDGTISWITPADMNGCGMYIEKGAKNITKEGLLGSSAKLFPAGSVIISSRAPIGYIAISKSLATTSQGCKTFSAFTQELVNSKYIYYVMKYKTYDLISRASGTTFKEISGKGIGKTVIPLPPIEEQQRIVEKLDKLIPLCESLAEWI